MIDAILISHSQSLIMLPYITEVKKFFGKILAPAPILRLGKYADMYYLNRYLKGS